MRMKRKVAVWSSLMLSGALLFAGCKKQEQAAQSTPPEPPKTEAPAQPAPAESKPAPATKKSADAKLAVPAHDYVKELLTGGKLKEKAPDTYKVKFDTTRGVFTVSV